MKKFRCQVCLLVTALFLSANACAAADTNPPPHLTIELRDGSRVVGTSVERNLKFHSPLLGDLKLAIKDIRSVECVSTNAAKLTMVNGDLLAVSFRDSAFTIKTSFGKVDLQMDSVRKFSISVGSMASAHPPGLVALWSGGGDARDSSGSNNGVLDGKIDFAPGKLGLAFSFNDENTDVKIPATASLNVGAGNGFTLMAWINPSDNSRIHPLFEWNAADGTTYWGVHFYTDAAPVDTKSSTLYANIMDSSGNWHRMNSSVGTVVTGAFQHVALTYEKSSGLAKIYYNGVLIEQQFLGRFTPQTSYDLHLGKRPLTQGETHVFAGLLDEAAIYNRALSDSEIEAVCKDENNGELPPAPASRSARPFSNVYRGGFGE